MDKGELATLMHPDIFGGKARQEDKTIRINISFLKFLLEAADSRAHQLGIDHSKLLQKSAKKTVSIGA